MDLKRLDASKIEKVVYDYLIANSVADFIIPGHRNMSVNRPEMVCCNVPSQITDSNAIGDTMMRIEIFVKQIRGYKNTTALTTIHDKIVDLLPVTIGNYSFEYMDELPGIDGAGYDFIFINTNVMIFAEV